MHHDDQEQSVTLLSTRNAFEADAIAAALQERGVDARVILADTPTVWGGAIGFPNIVVLASQLDRARKALEEIKAQSSQIDWDQVDLGHEPADLRLSEPTRARRIQRTLMIVFVPVGLAILSWGVDRGDRVIQLFGGLLIFASLTMAANLFLKPGPDLDDEQV